MNIRSRGTLGGVRVLGWVLGPITLGVTVAVFAVVAQHDGQKELRAGGSSGGIPDYPLFGHVVVMVLMGAVAVASAAGLVRAGARAVAWLPLLAAAAGPMAIVAAPARSSLVSLETGDTAGWWHVVVGAVLLAVLVGWTLCIGYRSAVARPLVMPHVSPSFVVLVLSAGAGLMVVAIAPEPEPTAPTALPILAWSVLAASVAVVVMTERRRVVAAALTVLAFSAVLGFPLAYRREGAGAAVAGWEFVGTSPVVLSTLLGVIVLTVVSVGVALRVVTTRHGARAVHRVSA